MATIGLDLDRVPPLKLGNNKELHNSHSREPKVVTPSAREDPFHMKESTRTLGLSLFIVLSLIVIGVGFMFGIDNPVPWIMIAVLVAVPIINKRMISRRYLAWSRDLEIGIQEVDDDHRKLLSLINNLQTAIHYPTGESFERQALHELADYTKYHFQREEEMLQKSGYPGYEAHKKEHEAMVRRVGELLAAYDRDPEGTVEETASFLRDWLVKHIMGSDHAYGPHVKQHLSE